MLKINDNDEHKLDAHCFNTFGIVSLGPAAFEVLMSDKSLNTSVLCTNIGLLDISGILLVGGNEGMSYKFSLIK